MHFGDRQDVLMIYRWVIKERETRDNDYYIETLYTYIIYMYDIIYHIYDIIYHIYYIIYI